MKIALTGKHEVNWLSGVHGSFQPVEISRRAGSDRTAGLQGELAKPGKAARSAGN